MNEPPKIKQVSELRYKLKSNRSRAMAERWARQKQQAERIYQQKLAKDISQLF